MGASFYLGRWSGAGQGQEASPAKISADRFTTHAVVIGMTGSGKTGLLVDMLEEAALAGIPALVIDPKGDLTNRVPGFPETQPGGVLAVRARRARPRRSPPGGGTASRNGASASRRAAALKAVPVRIFTPGSLASPLNVLERFASPGTDDPEAMTDKALSAVASLFALAGLDADPSTSPEGLLLGQLLLRAWSGGAAPSSGEPRPAGPQPAHPEDRDHGPGRGAAAQRPDGPGHAPERAPGFALPLRLAAGAAPRSGRGPGRRRRGRPDYLHPLPPVGGRAALLPRAPPERPGGWVRRRPGSDSLRALVLFDEVFGFFPPYP